MATVQWRRNKQVTVYYWERNKNTALSKLVQLPREQTKHLDGKPKDFVYKWVEDWEREHGRIKARSERINLRENEQLSIWWKQYQFHRKKNKKRRERTTHQEDEIFHRHILPFFVKKHSKKNPADWHALVPAFHDHLYEQDYADSTVQKILWALERFGHFLVFRNRMTFPFVVDTPSRDNYKTTPLKVRKHPDEIIQFVKNAKYEGTDIDFNLAILLGYFAALSPSEVFALNKSDFLTGIYAKEASKTYLGFQKHTDENEKFQLGTGLSVSVTKTLPCAGKNNKPINLTKNHYRTGIVNIWHPEAAKLIALLLKDKKNGRLFPYSYGHLTRFWREKVKAKLHVTPHDLRRASCVYLGRTVRIELTLLQEHMRHSEIDTTMLYTRTPVEEKATMGIQNLDDVA